ncbi:MAG: NAD(P)-binding domain-containing protein [Candidatus Zixiibacteriota bacterium]
MNIGILGTGEVGRTLGTGFIGLGHDVMIGSRDAQKPELQEWAKKNGGKAGTFADTATFGEVILLCTNWSGTENAIKLAGVSNFNGKLVIDVTNPLSFANGVPQLAVGFSDSGGEIIQRLLPNAKVVKAWNTITAKFMTDGRFPEGNCEMFIAGNDGPSKEKVREFLTSFYWNTHDLGGIEQSRLLESFAMLWIWFGVRTGIWNHAFKLVRK